MPGREMKKLTMVKISPTETATCGTKLKRGENFRKTNSLTPIPEKENILNTEDTKNSM